MMATAQIKEEFAVCNKTVSFHKQSLDELSGILQLFKVERLEFRSGLDNLSSQVE